MRRWSQTPPTSSLLSESSYAEKYRKIFFILSAWAFVTQSPMRKHFFGCLPFNLFELPLLPFPKQRVFEDQVVILLLNFVKIIHVKLNYAYCYLTNKTREISVPKVFGQYFLSECHDIANHEADAILLPPYHMLKFRVLNETGEYFQDFVSFNEKRSNRITRPSSWSHLPLCHNVEFLYRMICD